MSESDLSDLFARDPLALTKPNIDALIDFYRAQRGNFASVKKDGTVKPKRKTKAEIDQSDLEELIAKSKP